MRGPPDAAKIPLPLNPGCAPEFSCLLRASRQRCDFFYTWSWHAFREQHLLLFIYYYRPPIVYSNKQVRIRKHDKRKTTLCQGSVFFHCCLVQKLDHLTCKCLVMMLLYNMYKPFLELHSGFRIALQKCHVKWFNFFNAEWNFAKFSGLLPKD